MSNFKILSIFFCVFGPQYSNQKCHQMGSSMKFVNKTQVLTLLSRNLYGTLRMSNFKILSMRYIKLAQTTGAKISAF
jgi:hypothetical protein